MMPGYAWIQQEHPLDMAVTEFAHEKWNLKNDMTQYVASFEVSGYYRFQLQSIQTSPFINYT